MSTLEKTLFIGNGLNRCLKGGIAWGDLLGHTAKQLGVPYEPKIEMPLEFERIINEFLKTTNFSSARIDTSSTYYAVKSQVSAAMLNPVVLGNSVHKDIPFSLVRNIITSNYDLLLEQAYAEKQNPDLPKAKKIPKTWKYILTKTCDDEKVAFYHPHGLATYPSSICLGYDHYMGLVEKIRSSSYGKVTRDSKKTPLPEPHMRKIHRILKELDPYTNESWEKFYTSDMAFVGFGLPNCESDIWWLLTNRAFLYYSNFEGIGDLICNHIIFYDVVDPLEYELVIDNKDISEEKGSYLLKDQGKYYLEKHKLLSGMHVEIRLRVKDPDQSYEDVYRAILKELSADSNWQAPKGYR